MIESVKAKLAASKVLKNTKRKIAAVISALVIIGSIVTLVTLTAFAAASSIKVTVKEEGKEALEISTRETSLKDFITKNNETLKLEKFDYIDSSEFNPDEDCTIEIHRAKPIKVIDGKDIYYLNGAGPVEKILEKHDMTLGKFDETNVDRENFGKTDETVKISRSFCVTIVADGKSQDVQIASGTVADAIAKSKFDIDSDDETVPAKNTKLKGDTKVEIHRVEYKDVKKIETVKFKTNTVVTSDLYIGQSKVMVEGKDGESEFTYREKYVDGEFDSSKKIHERVIKGVVDKKIFKGRVPKVGKIKLKAGLKPISELKAPSKLKLGPDGLPTNYKRVVDGTAKAYYGGWGTASGRKPMPGHIAVDPKQFPYGTELYIVSLDGKQVYGYCIAADTGAFVGMEACTVDLYMNTRAECCAWGHRGVRIYVL